MQRPATLQFSNAKFVGPSESLDGLISGFYETKNHDDAPDSDRYFIVVIKGSDPNNRIQLAYAACEANCFHRFYFDETWSDWAAMSGEGGGGNFPYWAGDDVAAYESEVEDPGDSEARILSDATFWQSITTGAVENSTYFVGLTSDAQPGQIMRIGYQNALAKGCALLLTSSAIDGADLYDTRYDQYVDSIEIGANGFVIAQWNQDTFRWDLLDFYNTEFPVFLGHPNAEHKAQTGSVDIEDWLDDKFDSDNVVSYWPLNDISPTTFRDHGYLNNHVNYDNDEIRCAVRGVVNDGEYGAKFSGGELKPTYNREYYSGKGMEAQTFGIIFDLPKYGDVVYVAKYCGEQLQWEMIAGTDNHPEITFYQANGSIHYTMDHSVYTLTGARAAVLIAYTQEFTRISINGVTQLIESVDYTGDIATDVGCGNSAEISTDDTIVVTGDVTVENDGSDISGCWKVQIVPNEQEPNGTYDFYAIYGNDDLWHFFKSDDSSMPLFDNSSAPDAGIATGSPWGFVLAAEDPEDPPNIVVGCSDTTQTFEGSPVENDRVNFSIVVDVGYTFYVWGGEDSPTIQHIFHVNEALDADDEFQSFMGETGLFNEILTTDSEEALTIIDQYPSLVQDITHDLLMYLRMDDAPSLTALDDDAEDSTAVAYLEGDAPILTPSPLRDGSRSLRSNNTNFSVGYNPDWFNGDSGDLAMGFVARLDAHAEALVLIRAIGGPDEAHGWTLSASATNGVTFSLFRTGGLSDEYLTVSTGEGSVQPGAILSICVGVADDNIFLVVNGKIYEASVEDATGTRSTSTGGADGHIGFIAFGRAAMAHFWFSATTYTPTQLLGINNLLAGTGFFEVIP